MGLKETLRKYPKIRVDVYVQRGGKRTPRAQCDQCRNFCEVGDRYVLVTTEWTFMRGDDTVKTLCETCCGEDPCDKVRDAIKRKRR